MDDAIRVEERWYVLATSSRADDRTRVLKNADTFGVFDRFGDVHPVGSAEHGLYHCGTRYVSRLELRINGQRPLLLNSSVAQDNSVLTVDVTTPDLYEDGKLTVRKGTVHLARTRLIWGAACHERLLVANYAEHEVALKIAMDIGADFRDIFEARGFRRDGRGEDVEPQVSADCVTLAYRGLDSTVRSTRFACTPQPTRICAERLEYELNLAPKAHVQLELRVSCEASARHDPLDFEQARESAVGALYDAQSRACQVTTSNDQFNDWIRRSAADLLMLTENNPEGRYPYAGVPWYSTPFGRDGILAALLYLWVDPSIARGVLSYLGRTQATEEIRERDAEPGKIIHETRTGELAALGEIPFGSYYGSVDSTPLFIVLAAAYYNRTGDLDFVRSIWPHIESALAWIERYGDLDGDGFIEYHRKSERGLVNQGWKDSEDAIFHQDGELAAGAIALCEVQGYVFRAKIGAATMAAALGEKRLSQSLYRAARELKLRFEKAFWCEELGTYALALDGEKRPCRVRSSNAGQVLWSGISSPAHARRAAQTLLAPESFSGWGIRTIAQGEARYNPMSYHNGSVWPHDNALITRALARYGLMDGAIGVLSSVYEASLYMELNRLPELYCGFSRRPNQGPTLYPVACSPQAWASASAFYMLQACLGLSFHFEAPHVRFQHPLLPDFLNVVEIRKLKVGAGSIDLALERHPHDVGVHVLAKSGDIDVSVVL